MEELIAQITEKTGVSAEKAKEIVAVVTEWVKEKLPEDMVNQLSGFLGGAGDAASSAAGKATGAAGTAAGTATGIAGDLWDKAKGVVPGLGPDDE
ncbi:MAG: DUF2267 domain-containing protein [Actinomycetota bacterium]